MIDHQSPDGENWKRESDGRDLEDGEFHDVGSLKFLLTLDA